MRRSLGVMTLIANVPVEYQACEECRTPDCGDVRWRDCPYRLRAAKAEAKKRASEELAKAAREVRAEPRQGAGPLLWRW
jgi:hypothetical protein